MTADHAAGSTIPLAGFPIVRTDDEEEGRQAVCRVYQEVKLERQSQRRRLGFTGNHVHFDGWGISYAKYHGGFQLISAPADAYIIQFCGSGTGQTRYGKSELDLVPGGAAAIVSPYEQPGWRFGDDFEHFIVKIEKTVLESHLKALTGHSGSQGLEFDLVASADGEFAAPLLRLVKFIVSELDHGDSLLRSPVVVAELQSAILNSLLLRQPHNLVRLFENHTPNVASSHVRRAEEFLMAHVNFPLRMADVASEVGVSIRSLQKAFREQRGQTLTHFLRTTRLDRARKRLLAGLPGTTVTNVALDCGFSHFGKFSCYYRQRFAESPSTTLARAVGLRRSREQ